MKKLQQLGPNYWFLWASQVVNAFGDGFYTIGMSWLVYARTGSAVILGGLWATYMLVLALGQTVIAPLVDWHDRRRLMIWIDSLRGLLVIAPFMLGLFHALEIWHVYVIFIVMGLMGLPYGSANGALVQRVTPRHLLLRANSWLQGGVETMYLMGPATAGLVIFHLGAETALLVDALTFWLTAGLIGFIRFETPAPTKPASRVTAERRGYQNALRTGAKTLRQSKLLLLLTGLLASVAFGNMAFTALVVPYVTDHLHATSVGVGWD